MIIFRWNPNSARMIGSRDSLGNRGGRQRAVVIPETAIVLGMSSTSFEQLAQSNERVSEFFDTARPTLDSSRVNWTDEGAVKKKRNKNKDKRIYKKAPLDGGGILCYTCVPFFMISLCYS